MTEFQWLTTEDVKQLMDNFINRPDKNPRSTHKTLRKLRYFCCACVHSVNGHHKISNYERNGAGTTDLEWAKEWVRPSSLVKQSVKAQIIRDLIHNPFRKFPRLEKFRSPLVRSLALAAFQERARVICPLCSGEGKGLRRDARVGGDISVTCWECKGKKTISGWALDPVRLKILSDAVEESGYEDEPGQTVNEVVEYQTTKAIIGCCDRFADNKGCSCLETAVPEGLLTHLRSEGPHWPGCWAVDHCLDQDIIKKFRGK